MKHWIWTLFLFVAPIPLCAKITGFSFWEPNLPDGQKLVVHGRAIKGNSLSKYDIYYEGEEYPVVELVVELAHNRVRFLFVGTSKGQPIPLSMKEIAEGEFDTHGGFTKRTPGRKPPGEVTNSKRNPRKSPCFLLDSAEKVEALHKELEVMIYHFYQ